MLISLSEIMNIPDAERHFIVPVEGKEMFTGDGTYEIKQGDDLTLNIKNMGNRKMNISFSGSVTFNVPCSRCLKIQEVTVPVDFNEEIDMRLSSEERQQNLEDTEYINGYDLDTEKLLCEEIMLGFPRKVLCDPDCKGLCPVCGTDLNRGECGCDRTIPDPRMAVIREFYKKR